MLKTPETHKCYIFSFAEICILLPTSCWSNHMVEMTKHFPKSYYVLFR